MYTTYTMCKHHVGQCHYSESQPDTIRKIWNHCAKELQSNL